MILPHGLENPRIMIELNVTIHSADILMKYRINKFDRIKNQIINWKKTFTWSADDEDVFASDAQNVAYTEIKMENDEKNTDFESLNLFVRINFCGITVSIFSINYVKSLNNISKIIII